MEKNKTYRFPYQNPIKKNEIEKHEKPVKTEKYTPEQKVKELMNDIEKLTKGKAQLSKKELIELKKKYSIK